MIRLQGLPFGRLVSEGNVSVGGEEHELVETAIDLNPALKQGRGHVVLRLKNPHLDYRGNPSYRYVWIQSTQLGLEVVSGRSDATAWVTRLSDGQPIADADVRFNPGKSSSGRTGADGTVQLNLPAEPQTYRALVVNTANDSAFLRPIPTPGAAVGDGYKDVSDA